MNYIPKGRYDNAADAIRMLNLKDCTEENVQEILSNGGTFVLTTYAGSQLVSDYALSTIRDRAANNGQIMNKLSEEDVCKVLNISWPYFSTDKGLALVRGERIMAVHSGRNNGYTPLSQGELFGAAMGNMKTVYPDSSFVRGSFTHELTSHIGLLAIIRMRFLMSIRKPGFAPATHLLL